MEGGKEGNMEGRKKGRETSRQGHVKRDSILPKSILANITWMARLLGLFCFVFFSLSLCIHELSPLTSHGERA